MASKEQILGELAKASGDLSRQQIEEKVGESYRRFQTQLDRWEKQELIQDVGEHHYVITDKGRKELESGVEISVDDGDVSSEAKSIAGEISDGSHTITDKEKFIQLGIDAGMTNKSLLRGTTTLIWNRGDPRDLGSVWQGFNEANIDKDIAKRWFNFWAAHIKKEVPLNIAKEVSGSGGAKEKSDKDKLLLTHDMDSYGNPVYVGEGQGALTHDEAFELSKIRSAAKGRVEGQAKSESPGDSLAARAVEKVISDMSGGRADPVDETTKLINQVKALKELLGLGLDGKKNSADEITNLVGVIKGLKEVFGDNRPPAGLPATTIRQVLVDNKTGEMREIAPGTPIIIKTESAPVSQATPIQMKDKDGNPMILDLNTYIRLEEHKEKLRHDEESHQIKVDIAKGFKGLLKHAESAMSHMGEEED